MLDQLVESRNSSKENTRRGGFLLTTFVVLTVVLLSGWIYSLFALDYGLGAGDLELSTLVAPVQIAEEAPPPPEPEKPQPEKVKTNAPDVDTRTEIIQRADESPVEPPDKVSTQKQTIPPRDPNKYTVVGKTNYSAENAPPASYRGPVDTSGKGLGGNGTDPTGSSGGGNEAPPPPPPPPAPKPTPKPVPKTISGGVINGKARNLVQPPYPAAAKAVRASGEVKVQVTIDEEGNVISASAVSGHPLLRAVAVSAARASKFSPTQLSGQPVKVTGVIVYNFTQ